MAQRPDPTKALIRLPQVQRIIPYSRSTIYKLIASGDFPAPVKLQGGRASAWVQSEILEHAESLIAQREAPTE
ncbi:MAG: transcriptional regulator [Haliea sp.]|nr:transcriptional regulator [Haliea sp.]